MKKSVSSLLLAFLFLVLTTLSSQAMDLATFKSIANDTIKQAMSGSISDIDALIAKQEKLVAIGVAGCQEYAKSSPKHAKMMNLVVSNADTMKAMTLEEIEDAWHDGGVLNDNGIDFEAIDHFGAALSHMDTVVHPATTYIALKMYKESKDPELLEQVKDELSEVLEHAGHL